MSKTAYLVSLTTDQLDQLQNDDIAVVDTDDERFVLVASEHESEAIEAVQTADLTMRLREVVARD